MFPLFSTIQSVPHYTTTNLHKIRHSPLRFVWIFNVPSRAEVVRLAGFVGRLVSSASPHCSDIFWNHTNHPQRGPSHVSLRRRFVRMTSASMLIQFSQNVRKPSIAARRPDVLIITLIVLRDAVRLHVKSKRCSTCRLGPAAALHYSWRARRCFVFTRLTTWIYIVSSTAVRAAEH